MSAGVTKAIFSPPLSQQRYRRVAQILRGAATVLDLGCSDGKFLEHLLMEGHFTHEGALYMPYGQLLVVGYTSKLSFHIYSNSRG